MPTFAGVLGVTDCVVVFKFGFGLGWVCYNMDFLWFSGVGLLCCFREVLVLMTGAFDCLLGGVDLCCCVVV